MTQMRALVKELSHSRIVRPQKPATMAEIRAAERELGVVFPLVYVNFLKACGVLNVYDHSVYGLGPYTHRRDRETASVIFQTHYQRQALGLPGDLIVVWDDCHADCTCLNVGLNTGRVKTRAKRADGECSVVRYDPQAGRRKKTLAPTFAAWLGMIVAKQEATKRLLDLEMPGKLTPMGQIRPRKRRRHTQ